MDENGADTPEQVLKFVPKERPRSYAPLVEEAGEAIIAKIQIRNGNHRAHAGCYPGVCHTERLGRATGHAHRADRVAIRQRELLQLYRDFIAEVRALRIELEAEMATLRAVMRAIEAERDHGVLQ